MGYLKKLFRIKKTLVDATEVKLNRIQQIGILMDYLMEHYLHGVVLIEYNQYRFYWKNQRERRRYVCFREFEKIIEVSNKKEDYKYFDNKPLFNKTFSKFMGREWIDATESTYDAFVALVKKNKKLFVKPIDGMCGRGTYILDCESIGDMRKCYDTLLLERAIVEEMVVQHEEIAEFNSTSVNTLRIVTMLCPDNSVKIMSAVIRLGRKGEVVDNFHNYGVVAYIDNLTGIVTTTGVDRDFRRYVVHPDSGKVIPGFVIPSWNSVVSAVKEAAYTVPTVRYVGWDVAIGKDGEVIMIEGNKSADHDVTQVTDQVGKWPLYKDIVKKLEEMKNA